MVKTTALFFTAAMGLFSSCMYGLPREQVAANVIFHATLSLQCKSNITVFIESRSVIKIMGCGRSIRATPPRICLRQDFNSVQEARRACILALQKAYPKRAPQPKKRKPPVNPLERYKENSII